MAERRHNLGSRDLGIDLTSGSDREVFRWLIACQLFGERISQEIAAQTFAELDRAGFTTPRQLAEADRRKLISALGRGGYRRYDESTATELIEIGRRVRDSYGGSIGTLPEPGDNHERLGEKIQQFKGMGPKAAEIFLREMKDIWI